MGRGMVWGTTSDPEDHAARSRAASAAMGGAPLHISAAGLGSRGGPPIWVMHAEGWGLMPSPCGNDGLPKSTASHQCPVHKNALSATMRAKRATEGGRWGPREGPDAPPYRQVLAGGHDRGFSGQAEGDPDGFAVFGRFPTGWLRFFLRQQHLGDVRRSEILHVCSGTLGPVETWTVDARLEARPRVVADGAALPFRAASFKAVLMDPPYSDAAARNLYGTANPRPSWLLREAARVVVPGGRIAIMHVGIPFAPPHCRLVRIWPISTGVGFRGRWVTIYQRAGDLAQGELWPNGVPADSWLSPDDRETP